MVISFFLGVLFFTQQTSLELSIIQLVFTAFGIIVSIIKPKLSKYFVGFILGYIFSLVYLSFNHLSIDKKFYNQNLEVIGTISAISHKTYKTNITLHTISPFTSKLRLAIYNNPLKLNVGEKWQFNIKLKTPNSYFNQGSFDYETYLFTTNIVGTGYVNLKKPYKFIAQTNNYKINKLRQNIANKLDDLKINQKFLGLIKAISIGDKSGISNQQKQILQTTNTAHLSVISGLHIGMIVSFAFILSWLIFITLPFVRKIPLKLLTSILGLIFAGIYTLLAGLSVPTVRAFIMLGVFLIGILLRNHYNKWQLYLLALLIILLLNPFDVLNVGFYLSFLLVVIIIYFGSAFLRAQTWQQKLKNIILLQLIISLFSIPLSIYFFGFIGLSSFIANLIAIPTFSIIIVPFSLLGVLFTTLEFIPIANFLFAIASFSLDYLFVFLEFLANIDILSFDYRVDNLYFIALLVLIIFLLFTPKTLKLLPFALILVIIIISKQNHNNHFTVLDVGQGSAAVITNENEAIIFDTGNKFRSGFSLAKSIIIPYLQTKNINKIKKIVISSMDFDHSGGKSDLTNYYKIDDIITSNNCYAQTFKFADNILQTFTTDNKFTGNNNSCVIKIITPKLSILLTGDIEIQAERYLLQKYGNKLQADVLIVPHHGSKTSSSLEFLQTVNPSLAIISAGFENKYNHPHLEVVNRYKNLNIKLLSTACSGQISLNLLTQELIELRKNTARFYHRLCL
jgi:competence protein ComEC